MLGAPGILPFFVVLVVYFLPESPRYLLRKAHKTPDSQKEKRHRYFKEAWVAMSQLRMIDLQAARDLIAIHYCLEQEAQDFKERLKGHGYVKELLFVPRNPSAFIASTTCMFLQQVSHGPGEIYKLQLNHPLVLRSQCHGILELESLH